MNNTAPGAGNLDAEELLHLALQAMEQDRDADAISYLKRGLALEPQSGVLHHLLGAMYAQLGMIDRAADEMTQAITLAPQMHMARFQLGLLYFSSANVDKADEIWDPLAELPADNALRLFRAGLLHLAQDEFAEAVQALQAGIERNADHPSLNHDMQMLAELAEEALKEGDKPPETEPAPTAEGRHVLLSGYRDVSDSKKN
jgi:tetratricopeptide (TPR) repeat protein